MGDIVWDINYDLRMELFFPTSTGGAAATVSLALQREIVPRLTAGVNLFYSESPREEDFTYQIYGVLFDVAWQF